MVTRRIAAMAVMLILGGLLIAGSAAAQGGPAGGGGNGAGWGEGIGADLNLTQDQKDKLKALRDEFAPKRQAIKQAVSSGTITREEARTQTQSLMKDFQAKVSTILTPEQLEKAKEKIKDRIKSRRGSGGGGNGLPEIVEKLDLSDQQKTEIKSITSAHRTEVQNLKSQVDSGAITREQMQEKMKQLQQDMVEKIKAKLTPEQVKKIEEWRKTHPKGPKGGGKPNKPGKKGDN